MSAGPRRFMFNRYQVSNSIAIPDFYADDAIIQLDEGQEFLRSARQRAALHPTDKPGPTVSDPIFGEGLDWAYREYIVHILPPAGANGDPMMPPGNETSQPIDAETRRDQLADVQLVDRPAAESDLRLCLFNVIVALEWRPSRRYLRQLAWAFRRGSDFLYDATDGRMAFGQVIFGGPEMLDCCDIQVMASNRLLPRAWVSGLYDDKKYMPIRAGRGVWHKNNHVSIPYDEPEGYRVLVHEWCHYALELHDQYLEVQQVYLPGAAGPAASSNPMLVRGTHSLVVPQISLPIESIMAVLEGTSELVPQTTGSTAVRRSRVWQEIKQNGRFPFLDAVADREPLDGPELLPLPLPRFHYLQAAAESSLPSDEALRLAVPTGVQAEHCWVYVIQGGLEHPERLIAQGTLDARSEADGFPLLGAKPGDTVVLVGEADWRLNVLCGKIPDTLADRSLVSIAEEGWKNVTPAFASHANTPPSIIDVLPGRVDPKDERVQRVQMGKIQAQIVSGDPRPEQVWIFPQGQVRPEDVIALGRADADEWADVPALDGHVLARWSDGTLLISTFSQGGGPSTHVPDGPPPISAGSSEGNVMLFFEDRELVRDYSYIRVVTTLIHGMEHQLASGAQARSYAFSLASNAALPVDLLPTLVMYFDTDAVTPGGDLVIHRYANGTWQPLPTYQPAGSPYAAVPLNMENASNLVALLSPGPRVERYRLYWTPRTNGGAAT